MPKEDFPESINDDGYMVTDFYKKDEVDEWIQKCINDFPIKRAYFLSEKEIIMWFMKWFNQFSVPIKPSEETQDD